MATVFTCRSRTRQIELQSLKSRPRPSFSATHGRKGKHFAIGAVRPSRNWSALRACRSRAQWCLHRFDLFISFLRDLPVCLLCFCAAMVPRPRVSGSGNPPPDIGLDSSAAGGRARPRPAPFSPDNKRCRHKAALSGKIAEALNNRTDRRGRGASDFADQIASAFGRPCA